MYGVPADLDLSRFKGAVLIQLSIGEFQVQFHFHPVGTISVVGNRRNEAECRTRCALHPRSVG
jgi:hypothetical protein